MVPARARLFFCGALGAKSAADAGAQRFWLAHYSPMITDPADFLPQAQAVFPAAECGSDGKQIVLQYEEN